MTETNETNTIEEPKTPTKKHYICNGSLRKNILRYQEINEDTGEWLINWRGKLKDREEKLAFYEAKRDRRSKMTEAELDAEEAERKALMDILGVQFMKIVKGRLSTRHFNKYSDNIKADLTQNALLVMITKIRNFRRDLENPFSYFTQVAWVELIRTLRSLYEDRNQNVSLTFVSEFSDQFD